MAVENHRLLKHLVEEGRNLLPSVVE